jgi:hypothetical protein
LERKVGKVFFSFSLLFLVFARNAFAKEPTLVEIIKNPNQFEVRRGLRDLSNKPGPEQGKAWAALVAAQRLTGHLNEAQFLVELCVGDCLKRIPLEEKRSIRTWICNKKPEYQVCK